MSDYIVTLTYHWIRCKKEIAGLESLRMEVAGGTARLRATATPEVQGTLNTSH